VDKSSYYILYKKSKNQLPIGDVIRVLYFLKYRDYKIVTNKSFNSFFSKFNNKKIIDINKFQIKKNHQIINLNIGENVKNSVFDINDYLSKIIDKKKTFDLYKKFFKYGIEKKKIKKIKKNKIKIGINWKVPSEWSIKSLPKKKWQNIIKELNIKNIEVSKQKKFSLSKYVEWIKSCDIIISVVGLGVHISTFFDIKTIMLVGPTDFEESKNNINLIKIFPNKRCKVHQKKLNIRYKKCSCMNNIDEYIILKNIKKLINEKK
jgi:ADP-heptose:LPS heptosyltransferase